MVSFLASSCETDEPARVLSGAFSNAGLPTGRIGLDDRAPFLPVATLESLHTALAPSSLVPSGGLVEAIRAVKPAEGGYAHKGEL